MKNRQFIVLCCLIVIGFGVIYYQNHINYKNRDTTVYMVDIRSQQMRDVAKDISNELDYRDNMIMWNISTIQEKLDDLKKAR